MEGPSTSSGVLAPRDWQHAYQVVVQIMQAQQVQLEELVWVRTQKAEASMAMLSQQQDHSEKIEAQQAAVLGASDKF